MAGDKHTTYEIECPACKTTKYRNPLMKLMVNVCGHALCDNCVRTLFTKGIVIVALHEENFSIVKVINF